MKKSILILSIIFLSTSCGNNSNKSSGNDTKSTTNAAAPEPATDPAVEKGLDLVAKNDCFTCHKVAEQSVGPAYQKVAQKYQATPEVIDTLVEKVIKGGAGHWGTVPMTPHQNLSKEDAKAMVKYVLSLK
ncbi:MAG: c-type cytochrome [Flavisolibacter sp.]|jgi:cytochrome c